MAKSITVIPAKQISIAESGTAHSVQKLKMAAYCRVSTDQHQLGTYDFLTLFNTILTDRGSEFGDPDSLETGSEGIIRSSIYFCDPMRSGQKGGIEQAHTMLRMVLPKKTSFEFLTQWDLRTIVDHINSTPRESLGGRTPYDIALDNYGIDILKALQLRPIPPDEVNLTPKLIRFNH